MLFTDVLFCCNPLWLLSLILIDHVGQEMSDILIYLVRLADRCRIDLPSAVLQKIEHNAQKYPVNKAYGNNKKYTAYAAEDAGKALPSGDQ